MKINPKLFSGVGLLAFIAFIVCSAAWVAVQETRENREIVQANRASLVELDKKIDRLQATADRIESILSNSEVISGVASWYGPRFHGRQTASGAIFNQWEFTLAHKSLPLGTWVAITNEVNGKTAFGIVTDRGPYIPGRDFDVSLALARRLGFEGKGITHVTVRILGVS